jgi:hypothetical protein
VEDDLVYVPQVGFRSAHALGTGEKHVVERDGKTFTAELAPIRDGCRLSVTIAGVDVPPPTGGDYFERGLFAPYPEFGTLVVRDDKGRDIGKPLPRWSGGASLRRTTDGEVTLHYGTVIAPLARDVRRLEIDVKGRVGEWRVDVPVRPLDLDGVLGLPIDARDTRHGVTVQARTIARSSDMTAVELEAFLDPPDPADAAERRNLRGIGCSLGGGRLCGDRLFLRDEDDNLYYEHGLGAMDQGGKGHREVVTFPPLPDRVRTVVLESEFMWIHHRSEERVRVPLPGATDVTMAGCTGRVTVTRLAGVYTAGAVRVEFSPADPEADEQLAFIEGVNSDASARTGMRMSHQIGKRPIVEVPEPTGTATEVELRGPVVQLRGPWRMRIALPELEPSVF